MTSPARGSLGWGGRMAGKAFDGEQQEACAQGARALLSLQLKVVGHGQSPLKIHVSLGKVLGEWRDHGHS